MSASTAALPNRDTPAGHRPLSAIAAAAGGGVPQARIRRVLADLAVPLAQLHAQGRVHGAIAMSTIGLDSSGKAHLLVPPLEPAADAEGGVRFEGYAAFEQYTDDPERPCGPWTDVYALSAVAHTMLVGAAPPAALARCVKDSYVPLAGRDLGAYDAGFLQAVDRGLSMTPSARPQDMEDCIQAYGLGISLQAPEIEPVAAEPVQAPELPPVAAAPKAGPGPRVPLLVMLGVLAAVALAVYLWLRPGAPVSRSADRVAPPASAPAPAQPQAPVPAPPALSDLGAPRAASPAGPEPQASAPAASSSPAPATTPDSGATPDPLAGTAAGNATPAPGMPQEAAPSAAPSASMPPNGTAPAPGQADGMAAAPDAAPSANAPRADGDTGGMAGEGAPGSAGTPGATAPGAASGSAAPADPAAAGAADAEDAAGAADAAGAEAAGTDATTETPPEETPPPAASVAVRVHVQPWGEVLVDGRSRGISPPLTELTLAPGRHRVTIRNPAAPDYHTTINVGAGESAAISHVFE